MNCSLRWADGNRLNQGVDSVQPESSTVHRTVAFNLFDSHRLNTYTKIKIHPVGWISILVEPMGIEPMSESNLEGTSPGAVCYLHSLILSRTNTLEESVAS